MRVRSLAALTIFTLSSGMAFADSGHAGAKAASGVIVAGAGAGVVAAVTHMFGGTDQRVALPAVKAPEISTSGMAAGLILLAGGVLIAQGRQRKSHQA